MVFRIKVKLPVIFITSFIHSFYFLWLVLTCGAVCVYPARVKDAFDTLTSLKLADKIPIAAVATGFPSGQYSLETRLQEIEFAVNSGAKEIDIVLNRTAALLGQWSG